MVVIGENKPVCSLTFVLLGVCSLIFFFLLKITEKLGTEQECQSHKT